MWIVWLVLSVVSFIGTMYAARMLPDVHPGVIGAIFLTFPAVAVITLLVFIVSLIGGFIMGLAGVEVDA